MDKSLHVSDLIASIQEVLTGRWTQEQLGLWAHQALLNDLNGVVPIAYRDRPTIDETLGRLMSLAEGPECILDEAQLKAIAVDLERSRPE